MTAKCGICVRTLDVPYKLVCGHEYCIDCLHLDLTLRGRKECRTCHEAIKKHDRLTIWCLTHCRYCDDQWISGSYGNLCEDCYFERERSSAQSKDGSDQTQSKVR